MRKELSFSSELTLRSLEKLPNEIKQSEVSGNLTKALLFYSICSTKSSMRFCQFNPGTRFR